MKKQSDGLVLLGIMFLLPVYLFSQTAKKNLDHNIWGSWNTLEQPQISPDGQWVTYQLRPGQGNSSVILTNTLSNKTWAFERASEVKMSYQAQAICFRQSMDFQLDKKNRRMKIKKSDVPTDTLVIFHLDLLTESRFPGLKKVSVPSKWDGHLAFQAVDSTNAKAIHVPLFLYHLATKKLDTFYSISHYTLCTDAPQLAMTVKNELHPDQNGLYVWDFTLSQKQIVYSGAAEFKGINWDKPGRQLAYLINKDTTGAKQKPWELHHWTPGSSPTPINLDGQTTFDQNKLKLSEYTTPFFSADGKRLFFGTAPHPLLEDSTLLPEERVEVEVWNYQDPLLYTQQEAREKALKENNYLACYHVDGHRVVPIGLPDHPEVILSNEGDGRFALALDARPYQPQMVWEGSEFNDVYVVDIESGQATTVARRVENKPVFSPQGKYLYWYQDADTAWYIHALADQKTFALTNNRYGRFYDEFNDRPDHPAPSGIMGWSENDQSFYLYDHFDIWRADPSGSKAPVRLTRGRERLWTMRYIRTDPDEKFINDKTPVLTSLFDHQDKSSGFTRLNLLNGDMTLLRKGAYAYGSQVIKARTGENYLYTKQDYQTFPDLWLTNADFNQDRRLSQANPQQNNYLWGQAEIVRWTSLDGSHLDGLLIKPENFDPRKKYPLIVNFYERSSHTLYDYRGLDPHRSQIVYPFYSSNGYLIFNPDIPYKTGYPGESAFNAILSGVNYLITQGFVDQERIGIQGHSWGGYQVAYLLTRTNLFHCAESGAPVVNMFSAYGGIRWQSGMSRMFQYEKDQSRIGGSIWQYPMRFIENSPIFSLDKITTPVLILHNDQDGAVPWYQGIEFFTAMRRLNKPAWLLNYNGEPHWPVKWQNRVDFQKRMSQFFDHFLLNKPAPKWMTLGIPALEKGINDGLELTK